MKVDPVQVGSSQRTRDSPEETGQKALVENFIFVDVLFALKGFFKLVTLFLSFPECSVENVG